MSDPIAESLRLWTPLAVLGASLLGSGHCAAMCGGLVTALCDSRSAWVRYQLGRWVAYASLGAACGWAGQRLLGNETLRWLAWGAALLMAAAFVGMGMRLWRGGVPHLRILPDAALQALYRRAGRTPELLGALSAALPCGWLHTFLLAAGASRSPFGGALLLSVFWLGTLPALAAAPWLARKVARPIALRAPRLAALVLIGMGVAGLSSKVSALWAPVAAADCHSAGSQAKEHPPHAH